MKIAGALNQSGVPALEAEMLLAAAIGKDRAWLLAHATEEIDVAPARTFAAWIERRNQHEPIAYILGRQEFFGRMFIVDHRVLVPRPSTEGLVRIVLDILKKDTIACHPELVPQGPAVEGRHAKHDMVRSFGELRTGSAHHDMLLDTDVIGISRIWKQLHHVRTVVDLGTGSGCIAITLALERPDLRMMATDVSADALNIAKINAKTFDVEQRVTFAEGSLLGPVASLTEPFLLVSNPPYIPDGTQIMHDVAEFEPHGALFAGADGMDVLRPLVTAARRHPACCGFIIECGAAQVAAVDGIV